MANGPGKYVVLHTAVGLQDEGDVVEYTKENIEQGHNVERLVGLGAIRPATDKEAKNSLLYGTDSSITQLFPPVPADANAAPAHQEVPQKPHPDFK